MTLADRYKQSLINDPCNYVLMVNALSVEDQKTLEELWANKVSQRTILRILRAEGHKTSNEAIMAHRTGTCRCPKS